MNGTAKRDTRVWRLESSSSEPIACALDGEGFQERMAEFREVLARGFVDGERLHERAVRWRFRAAPGLESDLRALAAREHRCCAFFELEVQTVGDEVWWTTHVVTPEALPLLEELFTLPASLGIEANVEPMSPEPPT